MAPRGATRHRTRALSSSGSDGIGDIGSVGGAISDESGFVSAGSASGGAVSSGKRRLLAALGQVRAPSGGRLGATDDAMAARMGRRQRHRRGVSRERGGSDDDDDCHDEDGDDDDMAPPPPQECTLCTKPIGDSRDATTKGASCKLYHKGCMNAQVYFERHARQRIGSDALKRFKLERPKEFRYKVMELLFGGRRRGAAERERFNALVEEIEHYSKTARQQYVFMLSERAHKLWRVDREPKVLFCGWGRPSLGWLHQETAWVSP